MRLALHGMFTLAVTLFRRRRLFLVVCVPPVAALLLAPLPYPHFVKVFELQPSLVALVQREQKWKFETPPLKGIVRLMKHGLLAVFEFALYYQRHNERHRLARGVVPFLLIRTLLYAF